MSEGNSSSGGIGFFGVLAIVFITLKLTGHIAWSWWWVTAPLWGPAAFVLGIVFVYMLLAGVVGVVTAAVEAFRR